LLNVASIALGVTVFLAIQIANRGAVESFRSAVELTTGRADLEIRGEIDDALLPAIAGMEGIRVAAPLVEGLLALVEPQGEYLRLVGLDPLESAELLSFRLVDPGAESLDFEQWLRVPGTIATSPAQAARMRSWAPGGEVEVLAGSFRRKVSPVFELVTDEPLARAEPRLAAMDIGWAQELLGQPGRLTSIQILLEEGFEPEVMIKNIRSVIPADLLVAEPASRNDEMQTMLAAFHLNLTAMSLVSIIVGMFLVYNSVSAAVVRRQPQIGILRSCGATRSEVRWLFLLEALVEAMLGAAVGILCAPVLAGFVATPIAGTISSLYEVTSINTLGVTPLQAGLGFGVGIVAALLAAWVPSSEAAGVEPAAILRAGASATRFEPRRLLRTAGAAAFLATAALSGFFALHGGHKLLGFLSAGCVIAGFSLLTPWFASLVAALARPMGLGGRMAADHLERSLHRNALTIAALAAAVAMAVAVTVMIHSFRTSVERWVERTLTADVYVAPAANEIGGLHSFLPDEAAAWTKAHKAVKSLGTFRELSVTYEGEAVSLAVVDGRARGDIEFLEGSAVNARQMFDEGKAVAVSESFVTRFGSQPASITLQTPEGLRAFPVAGVYRDFTRESGTILMPRKLFESAWADNRLHSLAIQIESLESVEKFTADFRAKFGAEGQFAIYDNRALRDRVFEIFEQTFAVTSALRVIAILVAIVGIVFSLSILATERAREIGVLRSVGASRQQILGFFLGESALIGVASALCGLASGVVLAMVLTWVVNKAFFGWSIALSYPVMALLPTPLWIIAVAVLAALYPAWRAAGTPPAAAIRFE
jgi:putative ABC transport system permease protein